VGRKSSSRVSEVVIWRINISSGKIVKVLGQKERKALEGVAEYLS